MSIQATKRKAEVFEDVEPINQEEEQSLEQAVFGFGTDDFHEALNREETGDEAEPLFFIDGEAPDTKEVELMAPAWKDEDDLTVDITKTARLKKLRKTEEEEQVNVDEYEHRLRTQYQKIHGQPAWAQTAENDEDVSAMEKILRTSKHTNKRRKGVSRQRLDVTRVKDANYKAISQAVVQVCQFHPSAPALLTAGLDRTLRLFQVDGKENNLLNSTFFRDLPIYSASFSTEGNEIVLSGRRKYFYVFDLERSHVRKVQQLQGRDERSLEKFWTSPDGKHLVFTGRDGNLLLVSSKTKQLISTLRTSSESRNVAFNFDGSRMYSSGGDGLVHIWDMNTRDCIHSFHDDGCVSSTSLAVAPSGSYVACGSDAGVVNVYDSATCLKHKYPKPSKSIMNLTTTIDNIKFNHDSQLLAMSSRMKRQSARIVQLPSLTVFPNWPSNSQVVFNFQPFISFSNTSEKCS